MCLDPLAVQFVFRRGFAIHLIDYHFGAFHSFCEHRPHWFARGDFNFLNSLHSSICQKIGNETEITRQIVSMLKFFTVFLAPGKCDGKSIQDRKVGNARAAIFQ